MKYIQRTLKTQLTSSIELRNSRKTLTEVSRNNSVTSIWRHDWIRKPSCQPHRSPTFVQVAVRGNTNGHIRPVAPSVFTQWPVTFALSEFSLLPLIHSLADITIISDGLIGNTFRDHAGLFGVLKHCYYDGQPGIHDILKSLLAYYIAFWHMDVIQQAESPLEHCVQLEGTHQLIELLSQVSGFDHDCGRNSKHASSERILIDRSHRDPALQLPSPA